MAASTVIRRVDPVTAKTGRFIRSFDADEFDIMMGFADTMIKTAKRMKVHGEFVYTNVCRTYRHHKIMTFQMFLLLEGNEG